MTLVKPLSICFVSLNAYWALADNEYKHVGGIERQQSIMSRWLAKRGHSISMVTWDEGGDMFAEIDGVKVYKTCKRADGLRGLRFFSPRWSSLCRAMKEADADIYYYNCGDLVLGQVVLWAHRNGKKVVYSVASDPDCDSSLPALKPLRERILYKYGLLKSDSIITQTVKQQRMLVNNFSLQSEKIPMPCEFSSSKSASSQSRSVRESFRVLWVGRFSKEKRLEWLLECAKRCENIFFDVIGAANIKSEYSNALLAEAKLIKNVTLHGRIPHNRIAEYYKQASVLVNTSEYEGFPNTFLEAWSLGIPVISTVDPDDLIKQRKMGIVIKDIESLAVALNDLLFDSKKNEMVSYNVCNYFHENHTISAVMPKFESAFANV